MNLSDLVKALHVVAVVFMAAPLYNLIVVNERVQFDPSTCVGWCVHLEGLSHSGSLWMAVRSPQTDGAPLDGRRLRKS